LVVEAGYRAPLSFGGDSDIDIFYRGLSPAPVPSGSDNGLHLVSNAGDFRYDNMQVPSSTYLNFTAQMTGEVWVRPYPGGHTPDPEAPEAWMPIFHKLMYENFSYTLQTYYDDFGQRKAAAKVITSNGTFLVFPADDSVGLVPEGVWSHLAFTYDATGGANNFKLFVNGQLVGAATASGNISCNDGQFFLGYYGVWDVAELRLWNRPLSRAEIAANWLKSMTGKEAGLNAYYTFKNTTKDLTGHGNDGILMHMEQYLRQNLIRTGALGALKLLLGD
jgi:hypothetical protein